GGDLGGGLAGGEGCGSALEAWSQGLGAQMEGVGLGGQRKARLHRSSGQARRLVEIDLGAARLAAARVGEDQLLELPAEAVQVLDELGGRRQGHLHDGLVAVDAACSARAAGASGSSAAPDPPGAAARAASAGAAARIADAVLDAFDLGTALTFRTVGIGLAEVRAVLYAARAGEAQQGHGAKPGVRGTPHAVPSTSNRGKSLVQM